jgi:hypothetical protein
MHRINTIRLGLAGGLVSAFICFLVTLLALTNGYGLSALNVLKSLFWGYDISVVGSLVAGGYGFFFGFILLFLLAYIYNLLGPPEEE